VLRGVDKGVWGGVQPHPPLKNPNQLIYNNNNQEKIAEDSTNNKNYFLVKHKKTINILLNYNQE